MTKPTVVFAHGLEGSPNGTKARFLEEQFDAVCVDMQGMPFCHRIGVFTRACRHIKGPLILVGSSMGAAVVASAMKAPGLSSRVEACVLLALPNSRDFMPEELVDVPTVILHGEHDELFSPEGNQRFTEGLSNCHQVVLEGGDHRLSRPEDLKALQAVVSKFA